MAGKTHSGWFRKHRLHVVVALTGIYGGAAVFGFGFVIGRLTEPAPEMPWGIHALAWLVLPLLIGTVLVPLASMRQAVHRVSPPTVGAEGLALVQSKLEPSTDRGYAGPQTDVCDLDSALEQFPQERPLSSPSASSAAPSEVVRVA